MTVAYQKLLFLMPKDGEMFLAAWAAIVAYSKKLSGQRIRVEAHLVAEETDLSDLIIPPTVRMFKSVAEVDSDYDLVMDFSSDEDIKNLTIATSRSAATGYGILLGFEYVDELIKVPNLVVEPTKDVCIINWGTGGAERLYNSITHRYPELVVEVLDIPVDIYSSFKTIANYKAIIGERSILTYLACCLNRSVFELYSFEEHSKAFLAKWSSGKYYMMAVENKTAIDENLSYIWRQFERIKPRVFGRSEYQSSPS